MRIMAFVLVVLNSIISIVVVSVTLVGNIVIWSDQHSVTTSACQGSLPRHLVPVYICKRRRALVAFVQRPRPQLAHKISRSCYFAARVRCRRAACWLSPEACSDKKPRTENKTFPEESEESATLRKTRQRPTTRMNMTMRMLCRRVIAIMVLARRVNYRQSYLPASVPASDDDDDDKGADEHELPIFPAVDGWC